MIIMIVQISQCASGVEIQFDAQLKAGSPAPTQLESDYLYGVKKLIADGLPELHKTLGGKGVIPMGKSGVS